MKIHHLLFSLFVFAACNPSANDLILKAELLEKKGEYEKAIKVLDETIRRYPDELGAYINRGADYSALGDYEKAIENYKIVIQKSPDNELALFNMGLNYIRLGEHRNAVTAFTQAVTDKSGKPKMQLLVLDEKGNYAPFQVSYSEILFERGNVLYTLESYDSAYYDFKHCIENNYLIKESHYNIGCIHEVYNQLEDAIYHYSEAYKLGDKDAEIAIGRLQR